MSEASFFIVGNSGAWARRKLLGLTPTTRAIFQAKAAGAGRVTLIVPSDRADAVPKDAPADMPVEILKVEQIPADMTRLADDLSARVSGPLLVVDSNALFQRDFASKTIAKQENTVFVAGGRQVAAFRAGDGEYAREGADDRAAPIDTPAGVKAAKQMLYRGLKKPLLVNGLVAVFLQRPMAHVCMLAIVNTPIRPNHVTVFAGLVGIAGAVITLFANSHVWMMQLGVLLYFLGSVFDCIDGDLARLKHQFSYIGSWLDTLADDASTATIMFALAFYQAQLVAGQEWWLYFGGGAALIFVLTELYIYYHLAKYYHSGDVLDFQWAVGVKKRAKAESFVDYVILFFKRDFFTLLLLVLGLFQVVHVGLAYMSVLMYLFAGYVLLDVFLSLRNPGWRKRSTN